MILMDVNILVYAHREDTPDHPASRDWVEDTINSGSAYGVSELGLRGFMRVVTHPKVCERPTPLAVALDVVNQIRCQPHAVPIRPGWWMPTYEHSGMWRDVATSPVKSQITL